MDNTVDLKIKRIITKEGVKTLLDISICSSIIILLSIPSVLVLYFATNWIKNELKQEPKIRYSLQSDTAAPNTSPQIIPEIKQEIETKRFQKISEIEEKVLEEKSARVEALFARYNSPMAGLGRLIINRATECGGDYKIVVAIAGNESGFGRVPYKLYNPFGYLDGVQYANWEDAVNQVSCKIAKEFLKPCNNDLTCIIRTYGGDDTDKPKWISNITYFMSQL